MKKRGRGRPRLFDENEALDKAIGVFWSRGFDATSLDDLGEVMGMSRPSMYGAFGGKESVFMRCLKRYAETVCSGPLCAFEQAKTIQDAVYEYLKETAEYSTRDAAHTGCMLGSVAATVDDPTVRDFIAASVAGTKSRIAARLQAAVEAGELPKEFPVERRAQRVVNAMLALTMRARHGVPLSELLEDAEDGAAAVLSFTPGR